MADRWDPEDKVYYVQEGDGAVLAVVKARIKRLHEDGSGDYLLCNRKKLKVSEMHHTREEAERALAALRAADTEKAPAIGGNNRTEDGKPQQGSPAAGGGDKKQNGDTEKAPAIGGNNRTEDGKPQQGSPAAGGGDKKQNGMTGCSLADGTEMTPATGGKRTEGGLAPQGSPAAGSKVVEVLAEEAVGNREAELFTRKVAEWLTGLVSKATERGVFLPTVLVEMCPISKETRQRMLEVVPWQSSHGYTTMLRRAVKSKVKGVLHVSSIHFGQKGFHGGGMYVGDAVAWLQQFDANSTFERLGRLDVAPVLAPGSTVLAPAPDSTELARGSSEQTLAAFGFGADGAMVNGTYLFALVALVVFAVVHGTPMPPLLVKFLQAIPVQHARAESASARMVDSMITSAVQSTVNRTMDDPLLLAAELSRHVPMVTAAGVGGCTAAGVTAIRNVVRLYKARTSLTPALRLNKNTEEATIRLMDRNKFAERSINILSRMVCKVGWKSGPVSHDNVLAPALVIGATLVDSSNDTWNNFAVQTADGQAVALSLLEATLDHEQAAGCTITRHSKEAINKYATVAGLWRKIATELLPKLLLAPAAVEALDKKFRTCITHRGSLFDEVWQLAQWDVGDEVDDVSALLPFVQKHLTEVRQTQAAHRKELRLAEASHPTNLMTQPEMAQLTTDLYLGKLTLDANSYRAALRKLREQSASEKDAHAAAEVAHIKNVQAAQNQMQLSDVVFVSPATGGLTVPEGIHWLTAAIQEASRNRNRVSVLVGHAEVALINIFSLPTHGMLSQKMLHQVRGSVLMQAALPGPVLVMYPLMPRSAYKAKRTMTASAAASGANSTSAADNKEEQGSSNDSSDEEEDIFGDEGQLPEVLTKASTTMSKWDREAALARDRFEIDAVLGQHDLTQVCPKAITLSYKQDSSGVRSSDKGLLLTRAPAFGDTAPASGSPPKSNDPFEKSAVFRDGVLVELTPPREFVNVSKKVSMECRRSQAAGWKTEGLTITSRHFVAGKVARGQIGWQTYEALLTDLVQNCTAPNVLVNDFMAGVGEVGVAAVRVKVSEVAKQCGVRVFYWGCDERRIFAEVARANIRTCIGEAFLAGELVVPGLEPVKAPAPRMASGISKAGIERFLPTPMVQLRLAADGTLVIPTEKELTDNPPVSLTPDLLLHFQKLREEFKQ